MKMSNMSMQNSSSLQNELLAMSVAAAASMSAAKESDLQMNKSKKSKASSRNSTLQNRPSSRPKESVNDLASLISSKSNETFQPLAYSNR